MLKELIFKALAFFDAQDIPLTVLEIKNYLGEEASLAAIENCVRQDLGDKIGIRDSLYFLKGREALISQRKTKYRITLERFRKAKNFLTPLCYFPYLRAVALSGSQALLNAAADSDIDLFIITKKNRVWLTRALISFYFQIIGQRRHGRNIAGRFCLNHYLAEGTEITKDRNLYTAVEYASLVPVIGAQNLQKFWQKNPWVKDYLPNAEYAVVLPFFGFRFSAASRILELLLDYTVGPALNYILGLYQKRRIRRQEHILVSDNELSFHPGSHGQKVLAIYKSKIL